MAERLVTPPAQARILSIPHEYLSICQRTAERKITRGKNKGQTFVTSQSDEVAAALLYFFERWTLWRIKDQGNKADRPEIWLFFSVDQIEDYEFGRAFGRHRITAGIDLLITLGFLTRRNNPEKGWDQTYQYRFETDAVQQAVNSLPPFSNIEQWIIQNRKMHYSKVKNAKSTFEQAIPHDPEQSPKHDPEHEKDSPNTPPAVGADEVISPVIEQDKPLSAQQAMFEAICHAWGYALDSLTPTRKTEIGKIASELVSAHADPARLPAFKKWLDKKAQAEQWKSYTVNAMKKYWPDYAAETAPPPPPVVHIIPAGWLENQNERTAQWYEEHWAEIQNLPEVKAAEEARRQREQGGGR
jgi:hypothetical protein